MVKPQGIPENAQHMIYAANGRSGHIWWWPIHTWKGSRWYWQALGNNGEEATEWQAIDRAKRWIRDSQ